MSSYFITGASRGIGFEFVRNLAQNPANTVIALVRDKAAIEQKFKDQIGSQNVFVVQGSLTSYESLKAAADSTAQITGGGLDYLLAVAAIPGSDVSDLGLARLAQIPEQLQQDLVDTYATNVIGNVHLINLFVPLIQKGKAKKVIAISSGMADIELIRGYQIYQGVAYSASKSALNTIIAKFAAQYHKDRILFLSISPGFVATGMNKVHETPEAAEMIKDLVESFTRYEPSFKGPLTPEESVNSLLKVIEQKSVEGGDNGAFISHYGTGRWL